MFAQQTGASILISGKSMIPKYIGKHRNAISIVISIVMFVAILQIIGIKGITDALKTIDKTYLALALLLYAGSILVGALRWDRIIDVTDYHARYRKILQFVLIDKFANSLFPTSAVGMALRSVLLEKEYKMPKSIGLATITLDYGVDTVGTFLLAVPCYYYLAPQLPQSLNRTFQTSLLTLAVVAILLFIISTYDKTLKKVPVISHINPFKGHTITRLSKRKVWRNFIEFSKTFSLILTKPRIAIETLILTFGKVVLDAVRVAVLFKAFGVSIPFFYFILFDSAWVFLAPFMFTPGGVGVIESGRIALYTLIPAASINVVAPVVIIDRFVTYWLMVLIGAIVFFHTGTKLSVNKKEPAAN